MDRGLDRSERDPSSKEGESSGVSEPARTERDKAAKENARAARNRPEINPERHEPIEERAHSLDRDPGRAQGERQRATTRSGRKIYVVSPEERQTLQEIGRFRVLRLEDLALYRYSGRSSACMQDVRNLSRQGLLQKKTVWTGRDREEVTFVALTKAGKNLLKRQPDGIPEQALYAGFVKPAELHHDAAIYPMFQKEAARIAAEGGHVGRIVLDYELKKKAYSPLAKAKALPPDQYAKRQAEIARENNLKVVNGHIALPDLRIEYITRSGIAASVDLELATESYHGSHASEKAAAGFTIYAAPDTGRAPERGA